MTGWVYLRHIPTAYYRREETETYPLEEWPPKAWRFALKTSGPEPVEAAFVDTRRFARIRLIDCPAADIRNVEPLNANGPDPVIDANVVTEAWLAEKTKGRAVPIKALLLDQAFLSGVGNWVGDEVLYQAGIHPAQRSDSLSDAQLSKLHESLIHVTKTAVDALADWKEFPESWLFLHRWEKGKKDATNRTADGSKITFVTVGGRTSAVVEGKQKLVKRAKAQNAELDESNEEDDTESVNGTGQGDDMNGALAPQKKQVTQSEQKKGQKRGATKEPHGDKSATVGSKRRKTTKQKESETGGDVAPAASNSKQTHEPSKINDKPSAAPKKSKQKAKVKPETPGRRRSARLSNVDDV